MTAISIKTLPCASAAEVFAWITGNLLKQGKRSIQVDAQGHVTCAYRGQDGARCAAGWVIGDDEYKPEFEDKCWVSLVDAGIAPTAHADLIAALQSVHDDAEAGAKGWGKGFASVAEEFGLTEP